ncbi:MAG: hypothetical protein IPO93_17250 [Actinobacteria bacterium]|jgi:hypothetical protein|nr:hypothetical protein [Actinomycetota bacterium]
MLTLAEIAKVSGVGSPTSAAGMARRTAPNGTTSVNYCYYASLRAEAAAAAGNAYPARADPDATDSTHLAACALPLATAQLAKHQ